MNTPLPLKHDDYGEAVTVTAAAAGALTDVDRRTLQAVSASSDGVASWATEAEEGSVLVFGPATPCHRQG